MSSPTSPPPPLSPPPASSSHGRPVALVIAALFLVAAILGVVGAALLFGGEEPSAADPAVSSRPAPSDPAPRPGASAGEQVGNAGDADRARESKRTREPRPTGPTAPVHDEAAAYRCWDGRPAASRTDCTTSPDGARGLRWVFPGAEHCTRMPAHGRVVYAECTVVAASGGAVEVHYSQWESTAQGHRHYAAGQVRRTSRWRGLLRWDLVAQAGSHRFKSALMYPAAPWSVTVYGPSDADRDEVLARLQWRAPRDLRGTSLR